VLSVGYSQFEFWILVDLEVLNVYTAGRNQFCISRNLTVILDYQCRFGQTWQKCSKNYRNVKTFLYFARLNSEHNVIIHLIINEIKGLLKLSNESLVSGMPFGLLHYAFGLWQQFQMSSLISRGNSFDCSTNTHEITV
jgi:hypothetical protein